MKVICAGWQITPCDDVWHLSSRIAVSRVRGYLLTYSLCRVYRSSAVSASDTSERICPLSVVSPSLGSEALR